MYKLAISLIKQATSVGDLLRETAFRYKRNKWNYKCFTLVFT